MHRKLSEISVETLPSFHRWFFLPPLDFRWDTVRARMPDAGVTSTRASPDARRGTRRTAMAAYRPLQAWAGAPPTRARAPPSQAQKTIADLRHSSALFSSFCSPSRPNTGWGHGTWNCLQPNRAWPLTYGLHRTGKPRVWATQGTPLSCARVSQTPSHREDKGRHRWDPRKTKIALWNCVTKLCIERYMFHVKFYVLETGRWNIAFTLALTGMSSVWEMFYHRDVFRFRLTGNGDNYVYWKKSSVWELSQGCLPFLH